MEGYLPLHMPMPLGTVRDFPCLGRVRELFSVPLLSLTPPPVHVQPPYLLGPGCNNTLCYDTHDECDNERKCETGSVKSSCCVCGGGTYAEEKGLTYEKALPQKTIVFIGGSHFSGTSLLEVRWNGHCFFHELPEQKKCMLRRA